MNLNEYQKLAQSTAVYGEHQATDIGALTYAVLALCGESGELANKLKKHLRAGTKPNVDVLADELGDVLWYVSAVATELGMSLNGVAEGNLDKLAARKAVGKITG
jgi:NTP pyrophosphatase (non-canonical NTP hydrolase)